MIAEPVSDQIGSRRQRTKLAGTEPSVFYLAASLLVPALAIGFLAAAFLVMLPALVVIGLGWLVGRRLRRSERIWPATRVRRSHAPALAPSTLTPPIVKADPA